MRPPHSQTPGLYKLASSTVRDTLHAICKAVSEAWQRKTGSLQEPTLVDNGHPAGMPPGGRLTEMLSRPADTHKPYVQLSSCSSRHGE